MVVTSTKSKGAWETELRVSSVWGQCGLRLHARALDLNYLLDPVLPRISLASYLIFPCFDFPHIKIEIIQYLLQDCFEEVNGMIHVKGSVMCN